MRENTNVVETATEIREINETNGAHNFDPVLLTLVGETEYNDLLNSVEDLEYLN